MKPYCSEEVMEWLKRNAYLVQNDDYYMLPDFPKEVTPDRIHIPLSRNEKKRLVEQVGK